MIRPNESRIDFQTYKDFRGRPGYTVVAVATSPDGTNVREWEVTKAFPEEQQAIEALCGFLRRMTVEQAIE